MDSVSVSVWLSILAGLGFIAWCVLTVVDRRQQRQLYAAQWEEEQRQWPMLAVEDFTGEDELAPTEPPTDALVLVGNGFVHLRCRDARRDGDQPCPDCAKVLERVGR